jgi:hypothetical protein
MNDFIFRTGGDWDSTTLFNNGFEVPAAQLFIELSAGRDEYGDPVHGGIYEGADFTALIRPAEDPENPYDIMPGRISLEFPGYSVIIENYNPAMYLEATKIFLNGDNITDRIVDLYIDINAHDDVVSAYVTVYKTRFFVRDEIITYNIVG